ncbi:MAG TPA: DNA polymerase III subunit gamma/tau [Rhodopila sp.]|uniref:DNA polymerase III subunit gamma/tau n=1 Tax=Rhodopila sp. TaxID=2480087 RepID=UPI002CCC1210|nr:DNA polymerase III subunit gamma/tau [Rhodopila sp.]HVY15093.1 DNA polymerase III subunit gamma/tau [Rhodopila sp.]
MTGPLEDDSAVPDDLPPLPDGPGLFGDALPSAPSSAPSSAGSEPAQAAPYRVLARKYRPSTFDDLIGQEAMVRILRNAFAVGRVAHAFMLTGVRGVGKTTTARIIARAMNCIGPDGTGGPTVTPCGVCANCTAILADRHPDVVEMDAASRTGVGDMREIIESVRFRPIQARTKIFILDEVHMLSTAAFNALLKTLEEPPPHVKFIFATTEIRKVPITVLSRCQRFDLRRVRIAELSSHYGRIAAKEKVEIEPEALDLVARAADGSVRDGLSILDQAIAQADGPITTAQVTEMLGLADRDKIFDLMEAVMGGKPAAALAITDAAFERGADLGVMLQDLLELLHTVTRLKSIPGLRESQDLPESERTRGAAMADRLSVPVLARTWQMLLKGVAEVETAPDRRAAAEMVLIRLCHVADMPTPGELVRRLSANPPSANPPSAGGPSGPSGGGNGGTRAVANGSVIAAEPVQAEALQAGPRLASFREVVALVAERKEPMLHAHLLHSAHLVRFAPPVIELRQEPDAPRDLCQRLAALLTEVTGTRWTVAHSNAAGEPTIAEQGNAADAARRNAAADHPLVKAILAAFPGARIDTVHDRTADAYGLPVTPVAEDVSMDAPEMPDFAPPDAEYFDEDPMELDP